MARRIALLIATYQFLDPGLRQLSAPAHDAEAFAAVLRDPAIAGFEVTTLVNEPNHRVGEAIAELYRDRRRDDLALLYFTGHGLKDDDGRLYLAMSNTRRDSLLFTALSAEQIDRALDGCASRQKILILDCCYSGAFPPGRLAKADTGVHSLERFQGRGRTVLTASDATQYSFEGDQPHGTATQSVFTRYLVAGLKDGSADLDGDGDGDITVDELYSYVHDRVVAEMPQQRPKKQDNVEGRTVIAANINWTLPVYLQNAINSPIATDRLAALDGLAHLLRIGNDTAREHARAQIVCLADDDSRMVSAAATARLASASPPPPGPAVPAEPAISAEPAVPIKPAVPAEPAAEPGPATSDPVDGRSGTGRRDPRRVAIVIAAIMVVVLGVAIGVLPHLGTHRTASPSSSPGPTDPAPSRTLTGHTAQINDVVFSPDGKTIATASLDSTARLWNAATGRGLAVLTGHKKGISAIAFSPDGKTVATVSADATMRLWNAATGRATATLTDNYFYGVSGLAISPDGKTIATANVVFDHTVRLWDVTTRSIRATLAGHTASIASMAFSPDGKTLATGSLDDAVRLWNVATGRATDVLHRQVGWVHAVAFSPDGKTLTTACDDGTVWQRNAASSGIIATLTSPTAEGMAPYSFSSDGKALVAVTHDGTVWQLNLGTKKATPLLRHAGKTLAIAISRDGKAVVTGDQDGTARVWLGQ